MKLNRCREGKANLERRVIEDEQWYRMRHWECMRRGAGSTVEPVSGWLFNAIANKHAEAMDNFPRPNVLPREEGDKALAKALGSILPVILQQEDFEEVYDRVMDDKLKTGTGIYGVFWDPDKLANARPRHFIRADGAVNEEEYADLSRDFVHVDGALGDDSIKPIAGKPLSDIYVSVIGGKIDELKEVTGNRDVSTGGTVSGVVAASAIAAMQEAGTKLSRDSNHASYRAFRKVCLMAVELIRQFYELPRCFRILGEQGSQEFISFTNAGMGPRNQGVELGVDMGSRIPLFDIEIGAEKQSPYSRLSQNEMAMQFFGAGLFDPARWEQALGALEIMDFDGKGSVERAIRENGQRYAAQERRQV